jgi:transcription initiation factor TFIIE subunit alpha
MRISNKTVDEVIKEVAGEDVIALVNLIKKKKNISEFKIAEMMNINVNVVRNMLYRLYHNNLVSFVRKKDKKKGWYIYYWTFIEKRISVLLEDIKKKKVDKLQERLGREKSNFFFSCQNSCIRLDFEKAMDYGFKCPECGSLMQQEDNIKKIKDLEGEIEKLSEQPKKKKPVKKK